MLISLKIKGSVQQRIEFERDKIEMLCETQDSLRKAHRHMKKYVDQYRLSVEFNVGDKVLIKVTQQILK